MAEEVKIPEVFPILPTRVVVFPYLVAPIVIKEKKLVHLIDEVLQGDRLMGIVAPKSKIKSPGPKDLYRVGTAVTIMKMLRLPDESIRLWVQGIARIRTIDFETVDPYIKARIEVIKEKWQKSVELDALIRNVSGLFQKIVENSPHLPDDLQVIIINIDDPSKLADFVTSNLDLEFKEKQKILETFDPKDRLKYLIPILTKELNILEIGAKIRSEVKTELDKTQKEYYLREQLRAIQKELGEKDEKTVEIEEFKKKIELAHMPKEAEDAARKELDRLAIMPIQAAEYTVSRTYLDWLVDLPWSVETKDNIDVKDAKRILDEDHYDLEDVKERILEYLAVRKLKGEAKGPILCFVGPPGVGKTSLGQSIARALGRKFVRLSLGGVRDEAEIRGHRRTYIGALPGRIIQGIKRTGSKNPVFMLDEVDKIGVDFRGDPASALLEVLDTEQNHTFQDHYLDVAFDLSKVMFITTANIVDPIPPALKDRMETLGLPGYIEEEKLHIAKKYLIPKQLHENGLTAKVISFTDRAIHTLIRDYTREAGLRNLEREIGSICRKVAKKVAEGKKGKFNIDRKNLHEYLGPAKFFSEVRKKKDEIGVATGVAWTPVGGEILFVEATKMKGTKSLTLTGSIGNVMKESAQAALSYLRSKTKKYKIEEGFFNSSDIHIHVPAGAIPKDGPSAGITITVSLASLLTKKPVKSDIAMTGEITLRGKILPVGGIKEKVLATRRAGINKIIIPKENQKDLEKIPENIKEDMKFIFIDTIDDALEASLQNRKKSHL